MKTDICMFILSTDSSKPVVLLSETMENMTDNLPALNKVHTCPLNSLNRVEKVWRYDLKRHHGDVDELELMKNAERGMKTEMLPVFLKNKPSIYSSWPQRQNYSNGRWTAFEDGFWSCPDVVLWPYGRWIIGLSPSLFSPMQQDHKLWPQTWPLN